MPQPTLQQVHINRPLSMLSVAYIQDAGRTFVFDKVFPRLMVEKKSDLYFIYNKDSWFRDTAAVRAPGAESAGTGFNLSTGTYDCQVWAIHHDVPQQILDNQDAPLNMERDATELVTQLLLLRQEKHWMDSFFQPSIWGTTVTGVAATPGAGQTIQWSDYTSSDPITDIETAKQTVLQQTGFMPDTLTLAYPVFRYLKQHPDIVDRIKYSGSVVPAVASEQALADLFGLRRVLVASGIYDTSNEGAASPNYQFLSGTSALLSYSPPTPGIQRPSAGYCFYWRGISDGMGVEIGVRAYPMIWLDATRVEAQVGVSMQQIGADLGYFFSGIVA